MTARKPKPRPRKVSGPTLEQRVARLEKDSHPPVYNSVPEILARLDALESRDRLRDKSQDAPVSNAGEAIGQHFRIVGEFRAPWWLRFLGFMGAP